MSNAGISAARPAAFFDRDGVLNVDRGYVHEPGEIVWIPGAARALLRLRRAGFFVFVVTNQGGIGRGLYGEADVHALHDYMQRELGGAVDAFRFCPHHPEAELARYRVECRCRKPAPGMIEGLLDEYPVRRAGSFLVGDRESDLEAAAAAGIRGYQFLEGALDAFVEGILNGRG